MKQISFNDLKDKVCVITGGGGVIGSSIALGLASVGVKTAILDIFQESADKVAAMVEKETGVTSIGVVANVLDKESLLNAKEIVTSKLGSIDILINGAGGNSPKATTSNEFITPENKGELDGSFFNLDIDGFDKVFSLNFNGTLLPTMIFAKDMVDREKGAILNISSMNAYHPLTKIPAYSAAKSSINNFTEWLAVHSVKLFIDDFAAEYAGIFVRG